MKKENLVILLLGLVALSIVVGIFLITNQYREKRERKAVDLFVKEGIAVVHIYGPIEVSPVPERVFGPLYGSDYITKRLKRIAEDKRIKAVVLRINSPGGAVSASQEIYREVLNLKKAGKKVVVSMGDVATSGAYYIACAADKILANEGSITGSIGVIFALPNIEGLMTKAGVKIITIKSGEHKDIGSAFREMTEEEREIIKSIIDSAFSQFLEAVIASGRLKRKDAETLADGRVFTGAQAKEAGLIDDIGSFADAVKLAGELCGIEEPEIIDERTPFERIFEKVFEIKSSMVSTDMDRITFPKLEYRWRPGI
jgi:protease-4